MKVLLIAEQANPEWVSVPLVGWSLATAIAKQVNAHIVTQVRNRDAFLRQGLREGIDFTAIDSERVERPMYALAGMLRGGNTLGWTTQTALSSIVYPYFERLVWQRFGDAIRNREFDLVHRLTPLTPTAPSPLHRKCLKAGVPFIMGPLNGGLPWPEGYGDVRLKEKEWLSYVRSAYQFLPGVRATVSRASAVIAGSRHTQMELARLGRRQDVLYMPENGISEQFLSKVADPYDGKVLKVCFVGRLVPYKGPDILLEAMLPFLKSGRVHVGVVGDGPMMPELKAFVAHHDVADSVTLHGWQTHESVKDILSQSHVLGFPSIREFGGGVVLEAMALGVVPVVVDYGGPGELVDAEIGIKVPIAPRDAMVQSVRNAVERLLDSMHNVRELSACAVSRVKKQHIWPQKAKQISSIYQEVLETHMKKGAAAPL
jgi:glycosyltransferase involved in cell wall biosynthesis